MKKMSTHMTLCVGLIVLGVVLVAAGASGTFLLVPLLACVAMMGMMVWMMMGGAGHGRGDDNK